MHTAKLIWITPDAEALVGKIARVSNPKNEDNPKLKNSSSISSSTNTGAPLRWPACASRSTLLAQYQRKSLRHRSFSFQEFSQRYAIPTDTFATVLPELRRQDLENRQNSIDDIETEKQEYYQQRIDDHFRESVKLYESLLHSGVAKECARSVLPLNTVTRLYMSGTLRSWLHYVDLRGDNGTQKEHMTIARAVGEILATEVPTIARAMWD